MKPFNGLRHPSVFHTNPVVPRLRVIMPILGLVVVLFLGGWQAIVHAQQATNDVALAADQGSYGIPGYVVGPTEVAAYACPDTNTAKCPIKLTLRPGTQVLIVDNVVGSRTPGGDTAWRKIVYEGQSFYVPMRYISVNSPGNASAGGPDISLVQTNYENDSTSMPNYPGSGGSSSATGGSCNISVAPNSGGLTNKAPTCSSGKLSADHLSCTSGVSPTCTAGYSFTTITDSLLPTGKMGVCVSSSPPTLTCPSGYSLRNGRCWSSKGTSVAPASSGDLQTWYIATDGRIDGNAEDRIAIYCRRTGRIEVWSIDNSLGQFLVSFKHQAVDAAGKSGFGVPLRMQGVVSIGGDGHGLYWAAIHGGPYNATGVGDFAKIFKCYLPA